MSDLRHRFDEHVVALDTTDPEEDLGDLDSLTEELESASVIGMGEATHGTREFFRMKHRLLRWLVEERGVRLFGLESNFAETLAINDYVVRGEGDPKEALAGIYFWTWNTEEVLALLEWLREFNEGRPERDCVKCYGFDAQFTAGPAEAIESYLETVDAEFLDASREDVAMLADEGLRTDGEGDEIASRLERANDLVSALEERFEERKERYVAETSQSEWELARRHVETLAQAVEQAEARARGDRTAGVETRDRHMAENVSWILDYEPTDRIALWGHNAHVKTGESRQPWGSAETMGERLRREYGDEYYALGFEFGRGSFRSCADPAEGRPEPREFTVDEPFEGGLAETLAELGQSPFLLDVASAAADDQIGEQIAGDQRLHSVGAFFFEDDEKNRSRYVLPDELDGLLYVEETGAAIPVDGKS